MNEIKRASNGRFVKGSTLGELNIRWRGGVYRSSNGYIYILRKADKTADKRGYVKRANLVWTENTGQVVKKGYIVHHKNGIKTDDHFSNLELMTYAEHARRIARNNWKTGRMSKQPKGDKSPRWRNDISMNEISKLRAKGWGCKKIARELGCDKSLISRRLTKSP